MRVESRPWRMSPLLKASVGVHAVAAAGALLPGGWPYSVAAIAANHALITATGLWPRSTWLGQNLLRLPESAGNSVAITIDDGPDPEVTPAVLDLLDQHGARATFFCIGGNVQRHPELAREIANRGHHIENHSQRHRHDFSLLGPRGIRREIEAAQTSIASATGRAPQWFRAPAGLRNPFLDPVLQQLGLRLASWTRRGFDTRAKDPELVLARLERGLKGGDILLLHDGHCAADRAGHPVVLSVLPPLLRTLAARGLSSVRLADAVAGSAADTQRAGPDPVAAT